MNNYLLSSFLFCLCVLFASGQEVEEGQKESDSIQSDLREKGASVESVVRKKINPLAPSKAAYFSAVFPGLGQIYNKRYWKVPIVYAAMGTSIYAYVYNDDLYDRFRDSFKRRRAGFTDDEFYDINGSGIEPGNPDLSDEALQDAQERYQRDRDLALVITIALYALNIIDANVDAHLKQFNVDDDLSAEIQPYLNYHPITSDPNFGLTVRVKF